jgi:hypothetical protein
VTDEVKLSGGVANAGAVSRVGDAVLRPATQYTPSTQRLIRDVRAQGFEGVPEPLDAAPDGRERWAFVSGDVASPPYPEWVQADSALVSVAALLRRFHDAAAVVSIDGPWNGGVADPTGHADVVCHNDVCFDNVVFRDGTAVALLDWEFAAPGRRVYDLAQMARMCVPLTDDESEQQLGWESPNKPERLRLVCDSYGLADDDRRALVGAIGDAIRVHGDFVQHRVAADDPNFSAMWNAIGATRWLHRRQQWWADTRAEFSRALGL